MAFANLREDYKRYTAKNGNLILYLLKALSNAGFRAVFLYRLSHWLARHRLGALGALTERLMHHLCFCWISRSAEIGPGLLVAHVGGLVIGGSTVIGAHCDVRQNVTFGGNYSRKAPDGRMQPRVGDRVSFGAGAVVVGPIEIGSDSIIGANAVVTRDVPAGVIAGGIPAQVIKPRWSSESERGL